MDKKKEKAKDDHDDHRGAEQSQTSQQDRQVFTNGNSKSRPFVRRQFGRHVQKVKCRKIEEHLRDNLAKDSEIVEKGTLTPSNGKANFNNDTRSPRMTCASPHLPWVGYSK